jgi:hypothetical protein
VWTDAELANDSGLSGTGPNLNRTQDRPQTVPENLKGLSKPGDTSASQLSLAEHSVRHRKVANSDPGAPTKKTAPEDGGCKVCCEDFRTNWTVDGSMSPASTWSVSDGIW